MTRTAKWIGLTGGIGVGKSEAAAFFRKNEISVVDLDEVGRSMADSHKVLTFYRNLLGPEVEKQGKLDRKRVREELFSNPDLRARAEQFLHPLIWSEFQKRALDLEAEGATLVICEAALLVEANLHPHFDELITIEAPKDVRKSRIQARDGHEESVVEGIFNHQMSDEKRRPLATHIVQNDGDRKHLNSQLSAIIDGWRQKQWLT